MNTIILYGHLGKDKEIKDVNGKRVMELSIATSSKEKGRDVFTTWWRVSFWDDRYRNMEKYLTKGSALIVTGELREPWIYQNKLGESRVQLSVIGRDLRFNPFGKGRDGDKQEDASKAATGQSQDMAETAPAQPKHEDEAVFDW